MSSSRIGPFVFVAIIVVGCLASGIWLSVYTPDVPSLAVAVLLAIAVSSLLFGILGSMGTDGFEISPLKMVSSTVVLIGGVYLFNLLLQSQFEEVRTARVQKALEDARFDFGQHVTPANGWFAIDPETATPIAVKFIDPVSGKPAGEIKPPSGINLQLELKGEKVNGSYPVSGVGSSINLGYIAEQGLRNILGLADDGDSKPEVIDLKAESPEVLDLEPATVYGSRRLYLVNKGEELTPDKSRQWGASRCSGTRLPLLIRVKKFKNGYADYEIRPCGSEEGIESSLRRGEGELHKLEIEGKLRNFIVLVVAADHQKPPFWSRFVVVEMVRPNS